MREHKRIALCLFGKVGSAETWKDGVIDEVPFDTKRVYETWQRHFLDVNGECDIFIHSWSKESEQEILDVWKPRSALIEKQKYFSSMRSLAVKFRYGGYKNPLLFFFNIFSSHPKDKQYYWRRRIKAARSRWYSTAKSIELAEGDGVYDYVVSARLDLVLCADINLDEYILGDFYAANFNNTPTKTELARRENNSQKQRKLSDLIFIGSQDDIGKFKDINKNFYNYSLSPHHASYELVERQIGFAKLRYKLYPFIDFDTVKGFFFGWKLGGK